MNRLPLAAALFAAALPASASAAQLDDPRGAAAGSFGGASVSIDYGQPTLDGRSVDELLAMLPEERVWRAGENQVTILETSGDIAVGGEPLPAGRYSLYLHIPTSGGWSLLVNRNQGIRLGDLSSQAPADMHEEMWPAVGRYGTIADEEAARIPLAEAPAEGDGDRFHIAIEDGMLRFSWGGVAHETTIGSP